MSNSYVWRVILPPILPPPPNVGLSASLTWALVNYFCDGDRTGLSDLRLNRNSLPFLRGLRIGLEASEERFERDLVAKLIDDIQTHGAVLIEMES